MYPFAGRLNPFERPVTRAGDAAGNRGGDASPAGSTRGFTRKWDCDVSLQVRTEIVRK